MASERLLFKVKEVRTQVLRVWPTWALGGEPEPGSALLTVSPGPGPSPACASAPQFYKLGNDGIACACGFSSPAVGDVGPFSRLGKVRLSMDDAVLPLPSHCPSGHSPHLTGGQVTACLIVGA